MESAHALGRLTVSIQHELSKLSNHHLQRCLWHTHPPAKGLLDLTVLAGTVANRELYPQAVHAT